MATSVPSPPPPPPPPPERSGAERSIASWLDLGRSLALILALVAGVIFLASLVFLVRAAIFGYFGGAIGAVYWLLTAIVMFLLWKEFPKFEDLAARRQYGELKDRLLLWIVLGILFFLIEGIVLLLVFLKADDVRAASEGGPPAAAASPAPLPPPVPPPPPPVGVRCPTCGQPAALIAEYNRYYCYRCNAYV